MVKFDAAKVLLFSGLAVLIMFTCVNSQAQRKSRHQPYLDDYTLFFGGVNVGISLSQLDGDQFAGYHKANVNFSGILYTKVNKNFAISTEVGYATKGSKAAQKELPKLDDNGAEVIGYEVTLNYAEIAVLGNIFDRNKHNLGMGLSYGRLTKSQELVTYNDGKGPQPQSGHPFSPNVLDWVVNGNLKLLKDYGLYFNMRFQYSILPARKDYTGMYGRSEQINKQWIFRLSYVF